MKIRLIPKRKLRAATTAARRMPRGAMEEYSQEPNMSFGRAIVVVVVLHLVAVAGICGFTSIRSHTAQPQPTAAHPAKDAAAQPAAGDPGDTARQTAEQSSAQDTPARAAGPAPQASTPVKQTVAPQSEAPSRAPASDSSAAVKDSGQFYVVVAGDTLVSIARKKHVAYDDLMKLNKISDAKKLKIGQKLRIPVKKKPAPTTQLSADEDDSQMS